MTITINTEIRKLRPKDLCCLANTLSPDFWKVLMSTITKPDAPNLPMFTNDHFRMIETAAAKDKRSAAEIFLDEWSTMGRKRPTVGILIDLLVKNDLFRAADYLAVDVLQGEPPARPSTGPAAAVDITEGLEIDELNRQINGYNINSNFCVQSTAEAKRKNTEQTSNNSNNVGFIDINYSESADRNNQNQMVNNTIDTNLIKFSSETLGKEKIITNTSKNLMEFSSVGVQNNETEYSASALPDLQELRSSELPLCINDAIINDSTIQTMSTNNYSTESSYSSTSLTGIPEVHNVELSELPLTVLELSVKK